MRHLLPEVVQHQSTLCAGLLPEPIIDPPARDFRLTFHLQLQNFAGKANQRVQGGWSRPVFARRRLFFHDRIAVELQSLHAEAQRTLDLKQFGALIA